MTQTWLKLQTQLFLCWFSDWFLFVLEVSSLPAGNGNSPETREDDRVIGLVSLSS